MRTRDLRKWYFQLAAPLLVVTLLLAGCGSDDLDETPTAVAGNPSNGDVDRTIVIGNADASNPSQKIKEFQALADYLVAHLESFGVTEGSVVIAQDGAEMARMMTDGEVDLYIDAALPSLDVCNRADCEFILRQWKGGGPDLDGVFVTTKDSGIESLEDLRGKIIMLEQPHSTVGHILPQIALAEAGIAVREVSDYNAQVGEDEVGYVISPGGQSSMNLLLQGEIDALAVGDRAFKQFGSDVQEKVVVFERTMAAPAQLVAVRPGFDPELRDEIKRLMMDLENTEEGRKILEALRDTARFDELPPEVAQGLDELYEMVQEVTGKQ